MPSIDTKGLKLESVLRRIALHVTGKNTATFVEAEGVWYLGVGYWRARVDENGVRLINPSLTQAQIETVEAAMNVLS